MHFFKVFLQGTSTDIIWCSYKHQIDKHQIDTCWVSWLVNSDLNTHLKHSYCMLASSKSEVLKTSAGDLAIPVTWRWNALYSSQSLTAPSQGFLTLFRNWHGQNSESVATRHSLDDCSSEILYYERLSPEQAVLAFMHSASQSQFVRC